MPDLRGATAIRVLILKQRQTASAKVIDEAEFARLPMVYLSAHNAVKVSSTSPKTTLQLPNPLVSKGLLLLAHDWRWINHRSFRYTVPRQQVCYRVSCQLRVSCSCVPVHITYKLCEPTYNHPKGLKGAALLASEVFSFCCPLPSDFSACAMARIILV